MGEYLEKREQLIWKMAQHAGQDVMVAFSGGADSSLLLKLGHEAAQKTGKEVYAVTMKTRMHPAREIEEAKR
ncbi:MAG: TIGR00268 family protein, partial [Lachnospiraceae bacterium]|nr:TIGR00268 family protein [Lachnospiraceae bacterium]